MQRALAISLGSAIAGCASAAPPPDPPAPVVVTAPCPTADAGAPAAAKPTPLDGNIQLPPADVRLRMFDALVREMERLDGDGLVFRARRREAWRDTVARLRREAESAATLFDFGRVFKRLDATYPNLHTRVHLRSELDAVKTEGRVVFPIVVRPERLDKGRPSAFRVASVDAAAGPGAPAAGDRVIAIDGRPVAEWADENEIFCEFPLREQCDADLFENLRRELLGWHRKQKLVLRLEHAGAARDWEVPIRLETKPPSSPTSDLPCGVPPERYPGFQLVYRGSHACLFASPKQPGVVVMRVDSFVYGGDEAVSWLGGETDLLFYNYWEKNAPKIRTLVIDVIENHGGDAPIGYYQLLFTRPFQEQYVRFKKIAEFERPDIKEELFWRDGGKLLWLDAIRADGTFAAVPEGAFLPHVPQFCADKKRDCRATTWSPRAHGFRGDVRVMVNAMCVSSCVGFVYEMRRELGARARLYGIPDSGDSAFSRLAVLVSPTARGEVLVEIGPRKRATNVSSPEPWVRQIVSVTVSTDAAGRVVSGEPQPLDGWVPRLYDESDDAWAAKVLRAALGR
jgi:hypothetical protein